MLLTAIYSEDEADVTAMRIPELAFFFRGRFPSDETVSRGIKSRFAPVTCLATRRVVYNRSKLLGYLHTHKDQK